MKKILFFILFSLHSLSIKADTYTIYAHGIVDGPQQVNRFKEAIITDNLHTMAISFPDTQPETGYGINRLISEISTQCSKPVNRSKMYMGQHDDSKSLDQAIEKISLNHDIILYGCSRGAATIINSLKNHSRIKAIILDACPADMPATTYPILAQLGIPFSWALAIFSTIFPAYLKEQPITPLQAIKNISNKDIPILLIHSQQDSKVPYAHSLYLYREFKKSGFSHVYLAPIPQGIHSFLLQNSEAKDMYLQAVHSFYKTYDFAHNITYSNKDMLEFVPALESINQQILDYEQQLQKTYHQSLIRNIIIAGISATAMTYILREKYF